MIAKQCAADGCERPARTRGWCQKHYFRVLKNGAPEAVKKVARHANPICSIDGCTRPTTARAWCNRHYEMWKRNGKPELRIRRDLSPEERFWTYVDKSGPCWVWRGGMTPNGYGKYRIGGRTLGAHRYSYTLAFGAPPAGMHVDHTCHNRACVTPGHLRLATNKQNQENRRGASANSATGVRGVTFRGGRYRAIVHHFGKAVLDETFPTLEEAERAAVAARNLHYSHNDADRKVS